MVVLHVSQESGSLTYGNNTAHPSLPPSLLLLLLLLLLLSVEDILRPGTAIVAAGYCMYGSATDMVLTFGQGVNRFILDPSLGEFIHVMVGSSSSSSRRRRRSNGGDWRRRRRRRWWW